ncbi:hypothetical protein KEM48_011080 [Puccinia striiformis f. sp. tritici PST-130]|nr:hypothetical protein KEM48_011080 [Puccinia striiformis f. sp. tritici PST-130]
MTGSSGFEDVEDKYTVAGVWYQLINENDFDFDFFGSMDSRPLLENQDRPINASKLGEEEGKGGWLRWETIKRSGRYNSNGCGTIVRSPRARRRGLGKRMKPIDLLLWRWHQKLEDQGIFPCDRAGTRSEHDQD